ncbi:tyrosine--tRNA ligase [Allofournierella massiliensis]|uniref:Tyrosine--tRNA ligase n=1 Tax=Allofournierella massiliensis TaxID=1650663 RepID=A0A4R1R0E7_9FIRM|nr:tyrosine--tRNA ligase [Fournierella massiliensis]TCL58746.1 tyrosyl-tRNA synthetase [Fournierella massiliensis]
MTLYDELVARGLVAQVTDEEEIKDLINNGKATFYIGFDPTADSLHVGHFMALNLMRRMQRAGNRPIALIGGGTAMVGDPSGRTDMRSMMTTETIQHNCECFKKQMSKFIDFSDGKALMLNNADWLMKLNYIELLREVGPCFSVNNMLRAECYKQRMEKGLSFLEFNYMIMQSYDFYHMFQELGCNLQCGGDDQWSNMLGGTELIRRKLGKDAYAMTITLLLTSEGKKMGKTQKGAVWLDPEKTSPYEFYQYWRNVDDADVLKCLRMLTDVPLEEIDAMSDWEGSQLNKAKELLAFELTKLVHSEEEAGKAQETARGLFSGAADMANMPSTTLTADQLQDGRIGILDLMMTAKLVPSKREARQLIQQGGILLDGEKVTDPTMPITAEQLANGVVIKKGKKTYHKVQL